jgi:hypothetical protein
MLSVAKHPLYNEETLRSAQGDRMLFRHPRWNVDVSLPSRRTPGGVAGEARENVH